MSGRVFKNFKTNGLYKLKSKMFSKLDIFTKHLVVTNMFLNILDFVSILSGEQKINGIVPENFYISLLIMNIQDVIGRKSSLLSAYLENLTCNSIFNP